MADFEKALTHVLGVEGGYVDDKYDKGGKTRFGITEKVARAHGYTGDMRRLTREQAKEIYHTAYWHRSGAPNYDAAVGFQVFDIAVNHGIGNAVRMLQRAVGVADDGVVGPRTLSAINSTSVTDLLMLLNAERLEFFAKLSTFDTFGRGWTRRVAGNLKYAAEDS